MMEERDHRHATIMEVLRREQVKSQSELVELLRAQGLTLNQATVSRDLRQLQIQKRNGVYAPPTKPSSAPAAQRRLSEALRAHLRSIELAQGFVVLQTAPAMASLVARAIDESGLPGVAGALAGRDTVFLAVRTASATSEVQRTLSQAWGKRLPSGP